MNISYSIGFYCYFCKLYTRHKQVQLMQMNQKSKNIVSYIKIVPVKCLLSSGTFPFHCTNANAFLEPFVHMKKFEH